VLVISVNGMISTSAASTKNGCQVNYAAHHATDHEEHKVSTDMAKKLYHVRKAFFFFFFLANPTL
jgi:hypothetical protein